MVCSVLGVDCGSRRLLTGLYGFLEAEIRVLIIRHPYEDL
jgi:hypothetical protein